jgi:hypothetical protein
MDALPLFFGSLRCLFVAKIHLVNCTKHNLYNWPIIYLFVSTIVERYVEKSTTQTLSLVRKKSISLGESHSYSYTGVVITLWLVQWGLVTLSLIWGGEFPFKKIKSDISRSAKLVSFWCWMSELEIESSDDEIIASERKNKLK